MITEATNLDEVLDAQKEIESGQLEDFYTLAKRLADGEQVEPDEIARITRDARRTADDLRSLLQVHEQRAEWKQHVHAGQDAQAELHRISVAKAAERQKLADAEKACELALASLSERHATLMDQNSRATLARRRLKDTASTVDPSISRDMEKLRDIAREIQARMHPAQERLGRIRDSIQTHEADLSKASHRSQRKQIEQTLEGLRQREQEARDDFHDCHKQQRANSEAMEALLPRMLEA